MRNNGKQKRNREDAKSLRQQEEKLPRRNYYDIEDLTPWNAINCIIFKLKSKSKKRLRDGDLPIQYR